MSKKYKKLLPKYCHGSNSDKIMGFYGEHQAEIRYRTEALEILIYLDKLIWADQTQPNSFKEEYINKFGFINFDHPLIKEKNWDLVCEWDFKEDLEDLIIDANDEDDEDDEDYDDEYEFSDRWYDDCYDSFEALIWLESLIEDGKIVFTD